MTWQFRRADSGDLGRIMSLETSTFGSDAWSAETMRAELENPNCWYLVAFRPETPAKLDGYAGLLVPHGAKEADIQTIAVSPDVRRSGLGRTLMVTLINEAAKRGADEVFLEVRADNPPARELDRTLGFEELAVRPQYYQPDGVDAIVMRIRPLPQDPALASEAAPPKSRHGAQPVDGSSAEEGS
jgi:ribosomal-protein-alanine acetyltransferase